MTIDKWIRESNLIEGVDNPSEDEISQQTWNWFLDQPLTLSNILLLHKKLMSEQLGASHLGKWRGFDVRVGWRLCPAWNEVPQLMAEWLLKFRSANTNVLIKQAHIEFEKIHPFIDGNGRTGRIIMNKQLSDAKLPLVCIEARHRRNYYTWFK